MLPAHHSVAKRLPALCPAMALIMLPRVQPRLSHIGISVEIPLSIEISRVILP
ncbi:hypothetical protein GCM10007157_31820 [Vreelandella hamiltonii]|uniref:Uncharacterized protein n=1 Tax=Vreelandella hamiltonii TaxID=502829 RepID=A0A8H9I7N4_9GAMM|nr:hypothetical protein GCM10007157_31820 [Halomonas hamiltonii]